LVELLSRGEAPELDPNELVEVETVPAANGPMTVETLRSAGIDAIPFEAFDSVTAVHSAQIKVPRRQLGEAAKLLDRLR
jgi:hypothetical protein